MLVFVLAFVSYLGYLFTKIRQKENQKKVKTEKDDEEKRKEKKTEELATEILRTSVRKQESFIKVMKQFTIPSDIATFAIVVEILKQVKFIFFDELVDILSDNYKDALPDEFNIQTRSNSSLNEENLFFVIDSIGLKPIFSLIKDENFEDANSLRIFQKIEEEFSTDNFLVKYICKGDGKKHWNNPEAEKLVISALVEIHGHAESSWNANEKEFVKYFSEEFQIIKTLEYSSEEVFIETLERSDQKKVAKVFRYVDIEDEYSAFSLLIASPKFFKIWLENTPIISNDELFNYLVWIDILPEKFKEDNRYSQAKITQEVYEFLEIDLNLIKDVDSNKNLIEYLQNHCDEEDFIDDFISDKKFIPCLFWYTPENGKWEKISQKDAQEKLDEYEHDTPYLLASYILEGYEFTEEVLKEICENELVDIAQLYFNTQHKKHFI
ncbi:MAG: hypothetical protein ACK5N8_07130 [Alphaproteobacteria bacterium]